MLDGGEAAHSSHAGGAPIRVAFTAPEGDSLLRVGLMMYYCEANRQAVCLFREENLEIPLTGSPGHASAVVEVRRAASPVSE
jgi:hypothetical protein